jgi:hypothetical protein
LHGGVAHLHPAAESALELARVADKSVGVAIQNDMYELSAAARRADVCPVRLDGALRRVWHEHIRLRLLLQHCTAMHMYLVGDADEPAIIDARCGVAEVFRDASDDVTALCTEKHGATAQVTIDDPGCTTMLCVPGHLRYIAMEVLKNAFAATHRRHGMDADLAAAVAVCIRAAAGRVHISVSDAGMDGRYVFAVFAWYGSL